jgi:hypothetical protein
MSRYYFNENPQVRHWMGKCATLHQELDIANERTKSIKQQYVDDMGEVKEKAVELFNKFNSLPWYKKMFFKFDV